MTFSQLIMNCYCVLIEILNSENVIIETYDELTLIGFN